MKPEYVLIAKILGTLSYPILEYYLGKSSHGSLIGVVLKGILAILKSAGIGTKQEINK